MQVKLYSTPTCVYCKLTRKFFEENNVQYTNIDVATDMKAAEEMIQKSGQMGVPVIVINKEGKEDIIVGFDRPKLSKALLIK